jgi:hypothetical protein
VSTFCLKAAMFAEYFYWNLENVFLVMAAVDENLNKGFLNWEIIVSDSIN